MSEPNTTSVPKIRCFGSSIWTPKTSYYLVTEGYFMIWHMHGITIFHALCVTIFNTRICSVLLENMDTALTAVWSVDLRLCFLHARIQWTSITCISLSWSTLFSFIQITTCWLELDWNCNVLIVLSSSTCSGPHLSLALWSGHRTIYVFLYLSKNARFESEYM